MKNLINEVVSIWSIGVLFVIDLNVFMELRGIMFDFATGMAHRGRKRREVMHNIYCSVWDFVSLRKLSGYIKINRKVYEKYYKLHSYLLVSIPIQYLVIIMGLVLGGNIKQASGYFYIVVIVIKIIIFVVLLSKLDSSKVSKYAKKEYKKRHKEIES